MRGVGEVLQTHVDRGTVAGAVALTSRRGEVDVAAVGLADVDGGVPMTRDTIVRVSSMTKNVTALATTMLVEGGALTLDDEIRRWLPELAAPVVVASPGGPLDDVVPADRAVTVLDLLTSRSGWGFASDFSSPAVAEIGRLLRPTGPLPAAIPAADDYLAVLAATPMAAQPGRAFLYDISLDVLGILLERVCGTGLADVLAEHVLEPLGMTDTGFFVPADRRDRFACLYDGDTADGFSLVDAPDDQWASPPPLASGAGGLVSTVDDWHRLLRLLLGRGEIDGVRLVSGRAVDQLMTNHLTPGQEALAELFLDGQGWGFGGGVDIADRDPWNVIGRYGWVGGTGTSGYVTPSTGTISIVMTQMTLGGPTSPQHLYDAWTDAARP